MKYRILSDLNQINFDSMFDDNLQYIEAVPSIWPDDIQTYEQKKNLVYESCQTLITSFPTSSCIISTEIGKDVAALFGFMNGTEHTSSIGLLTGDENGSRSYIYSPEWLSTIIEFQKSIGAESGIFQFFENSPSLQPSINAYNITQDKLSYVDLGIIKYVSMKIW